MLLAITLLLLGSAVYIITTILIPSVDARRQAWETRKELDIERKLDKMFYNKSPRAIVRLYYILPLVLAAAGWFLSNAQLFALIGAIIGLWIPNFILSIRDKRRKQKFNAQLLDAIMILSSSLKGGLSLLQGLEVIVEEMPAPMSQETGLVIRENKMGVSLDESLRNLKNRINIEELELVINSMLVARETGGDLMKVLSRLSVTIRDNRKLKDSIRTLTLQGRMQGVVMSILPFIFVWWVLMQDKHHFDIMLQNETGKMLLLVALVLQVIGMILIKRFSTIRI